MKLILLIFLLFTAFSLQCSYGYRLGTARYFKMTINFADVPLAPAMITIWTPPKGNWILDWSQDFINDYFSLGTAVMGECNPDDTGDSAYVYTDHHDTSIFVLGNGVWFDEVIHGPFWCDTSNLYYGNEGNITMFYGNAYFLPQAQGELLNPYAGVLSLGEAGIGGEYQPNNIDLLWGFGVNQIGAHGSSWTVPPSMTPPVPFDQVIYNQSYPLRIQWTKSDAYTATFPNTGSWTFFIRGMKVN